MRTQKASTPALTTRTARPTRTRRLAALSLATLTAAGLSTAALASSALAAIDEYLGRLFAEAP